MKITRITALAGPNRYCKHPVLRIRFDFPELQQSPRLADRNALNKALSELITGFAEIADSAQGDRTGINVIDLIPAIALALQNLTGCQLKFQQSARVASPHNSSTSFEAVFEYESSTIARLATPLSFKIIFAVLQRRFGITLPEALQAPDSFNIEQQITHFLKTTVQAALDDDTRTLIQALEKRHIPWHRTDDSSRIIQAGYGVHRKLVYGTITSDTTVPGSMVSRDKFLSNTLLKNAGFPVPRQASASSLEQAKLHAQSFEYPVVVKPAMGAKSNKVAFKVPNESELEAVFGRIQKLCEQIIIETFIPGENHRFLVVANSVVAVARRRSNHVHGDHEQMIDMNTDTSSVEVIDQTHPDNIAMAERVAAVTGLDIVGVDFISSDISRSYLETGGGIYAINLGPSLRPHSATEGGKAGSIPRTIVEHLFPTVITCNGLPLCAAITGTNGKTTTCRMLDAILRQAGLNTGMANSDGAYINGHLVLQGDQAGFSGARTVLSDSRLEAAVLETSPEGILESGMGFSACTVSAVLNITPDYLGFDGLHSLEEMAELHQLVAELSQDTVVLNADDPLCIDMIQHLGERKLSLVTRDPDNSSIMIPIANVDSVVTLGKSKNKKTEHIVIRANGEETIVLKTWEIPATFEGLAQHNIDNAMSAIALAHNMGITIESIRTALRKFTCSFENSPGRSNIIHDKDFTVMLDFAHNPEGVRAIGELVENMESEGKRICILSSPANRRSDHFLAMAEAAAESFDHIICSNWYDLHGQPPELVPDKFEETLRNCGFNQDEITVCNDAGQSIKTAIQKLEEEDILVIFGDQADRRRQQVMEILGTSSGDE